MPDFRGKWRILRSFGRLVDGTPVRTRYPGIRLELRTADRTNQLCILGKHDRTVADAVAQLEAGQCFVDIGANCGLYSVMASQRVGPTGLVIAFEPCATTFALLEQNLSLNGARNVLAENKAVAAVPGPALLDMTTTGHTGRFAITEREDQAGTPVQCTRIDADDRMSAAIGDRPTVIKVDVEGYEVAALQGVTSLLLRPQTYMVVVEVDDANLRRYGESRESLYRLLENYGFTPATSSNHAAHFDEVFTRTS